MFGDLFYLNVVTLTVGIRVMRRMRAAQSSQPSSSLVAGASVHAPRHDDT
jgi:hypothetical protein